MARHPDLWHTAFVRRESTDKLNSSSKSTEPVTVKEYRAAAGGFGALVSVFEMSYRQTGFLRAARTLAKINQPGGFDCSSCAWPDPRADERTAFEFCENGAKATLWDQTKKQPDDAFWREHSVADLQTWSDYQLEDIGRLTQPLAYDQQTDRYIPVTWSKAFEAISHALRHSSAPNRNIFYTSGRTSNEAAYLYQLMVRLLGTNNLPDCSNMCHESSGTGLTETIGIGKGTVSLDDFDAADAIFVIGQNPGTNHPRMLTTLEQASKRGAQIIAVNPLKERGLERFSHPQNPLAILGQSTPIATHYLQVKLNGDVALLQGIAKHLIELDSHQPTLDYEFIAEHTEGFEDYKAHLNTLNVHVLQQTHSP